MSEPGHGQPEVALPAPDGVAGLPEVTLPHPLGTRCYFTGNGFLKALGRRPGKSGHEWLKASFDRLIACAVEVRDTRRGLDYTGSLILEVARDLNDPHQKNSRAESRFFS